MAVNGVHLISKHGTSPPTTVSLNVGSIAANLSFLDMRHAVYQQALERGAGRLRPFELPTEFRFLLYAVWETGS